MNKLSLEQFLEIYNFCRKGNGWENPYKIGNYYISRLNLHPYGRFYADFQLVDGFEYYNPGNDKRVLLSELFELPEELLDRKYWQAFYYAQNDELTLDRFASIK